MVGCAFCDKPTIYLAAASPRCCWSAWCSAKRRPTRWVIFTYRAVKKTNGKVQGIAKNMSFSKSFKISDNGSSTTTTSAAAAYQHNCRRKEVRSCPMFYCGRTSRKNQSIGQPNYCTCWNKKWRVSVVKQKSRRINGDSRRQRTWENPWAAFAPSPSWTAAADRALTVERLPSCREYL